VNERADDTGGTQTAACLIRYRLLLKKMPTVVRKKRPATKSRKSRTVRPVLKLVRDPATGLRILPAQPGRAPITSEDVARALIEFP
jgi:hypothetical protein